MTKSELIEFQQMCRLCFNFEHSISHVAFSPDLIVMAFRNCEVEEF